MLKMAPNFVLGRYAPSTYYKKVRLGASLPAASPADKARLGAPGWAGENKAILSILILFVTRTRSVLLLCELHEVRFTSF